MNRYEISEKLEENYDAIAPIDEDQLRWTCCDVCGDYCDCYEAKYLEKYWHKDTLFILGSMLYKLNLSQSVSFLMHDRHLQIDICHSCLYIYHYGPEEDA